MGETTHRSVSPGETNADFAVGVRPLALSDDGRRLRLLDQRALPGQERWLEYDDVEGVARAIEDMVVRGAPAIACAAAGVFAA